MTPSSCWRTSSARSPTGLDARAATIKAMDEITGPIIAITLVLISVFLPAAFLPGITGQFFRQFALTIASAMVISAINAMTLTPSRAVSIFKTEADSEGGHEMHARGPAVVDLRALRRAGHGLAGQAVPRRAAGAAAGRHAGVRAGSEWLLYAVIGLSSCPGLLAGGLLGWSSSGRSTSCSGRFFRGFNWVFDRFTAVYGRTVGRPAAPQRDRAAALRRAAVPDRTGR